MFEGEKNTKHNTQGTAFSAYATSHLTFVAIMRIARVQGTSLPKATQSGLSIKNPSGNGISAFRKLITSLWIWNLKMLAFTP
jgi:hypothetical protein